MYVYLGSHCHQNLQHSLLRGCFGYFIGPDESQVFEVSGVGRKTSWGGHYCCVPDCHNSSRGNVVRKKSNLPKVSFHSFPDAKSDKGRKWVKLIRRDIGSDFEINKNTKICSAHFVPNDYQLIFEGKRRLLKPTAIPSQFPWTKNKRRTSMTSNNAMQKLVDEPLKQSTHPGSINAREQRSLCSTAAITECTDVLQVNDEVIMEEQDELKRSDISLLHEIDQLKIQLAEAESKLSRSLLRLYNIRHDKGLLKFYTGFSNYDTLLAFYEEVLEPDAVLMRQWSGKRSEQNYSDEKGGPSCKLPLKEQLFLTLVRLRTGFPELDIANRFGISQSTVSRVTNTWINLMYHNFKSIERFPPWHIVKKYMPAAFKKEYPNTRIIIDATEFQVQRPSSLLTQACTFSAYKNRNTVKVLIGVTPSGAISFVSEAYEGSISDKKLVDVRGLLDKLEPGDEVMADKGFLIQDLLIPRGVRLNIPPFLQKNTQMAANDVFLTKKIARLRVHVERAIGRVKEYKILQSTLPASMWDSISNVIYVCCMLSNFEPPLVC